MNNYLLEASDHLLIQKEINNIIAKEKFENQYQVSYDLEEVPLANALEDLDTYSLLSDKKVIIIKNILATTVENEIKHLLKYLENYNSNNLLILTCDKLDSKSFAKKLKASKNIKYQKIEIDDRNYIINKLKNYKIDNEAISYLLELCKGDITKIDTECEKLIFYKIDSKEITKEDIKKIAIEKLGESNDILFSFVNAIINKDKKKSLSLYEQLKKYAVDSSSIIGLMASQMKLISQIKVLKEQNLNNIEIQQQLQLKSIYQVKKLSEYIYLYTLKEIGEFFNKLADIDYQIKTGRVDGNIAIELLIINL